MSEQNVEIVRRMYEAFHGGDAEGALAYFHPEVIVDASGRVDGGIGHGREELSRLIATWVGTFDEWREEIEEMRDLGSQVYVVATQRGRGKGSGVEVDYRYALLYEVQRDKITSMTIYNTPEDALEAAGSSNQVDHG
jgi:ketosteroid isomerase-like protein